MQRKGIGAGGGGRVRAVATAAAAAALVAGVAAPAQAQRLADYDYEHLTFRGLGADVGYIWPNRVNSTPAYSVRADLGYLGPGVRIAPSLTYWSSTLKLAELDRLAERINRLDPLQEQGTEVRGSDLGPIQWRNVSLSVDGHFVWVAPMGLLPYVGAGAAMHVMNGSGPVVDDTFIEDLLNRVSAGAAAIAGFELDVWRSGFRLYGEGRYSVLSNLRFPSLRLGGAFVLPNRGAWVGSRRSPIGAPAAPSRPTGSGAAPIDTDGGDG